MEIQREKVLNALPEPKNHAQLLLKLYHSNETLDVKPTKTSSTSCCKKCLTPWSSGLFTLNMKPSNHRRKKRRQFKIEKLQKALKTVEKKKELAKLKRQIEHLQEQNNHVAIYKCQLCRETTPVQCWKPKTSAANKQDNHESVTSATDNKHEVVTNKPKKSKTKKKKTAGLIIPPTRVQQTPAQQQRQLSMTKLSNIIQQSQKQLQTPASKLNQFLK